MTTTHHTLGSTAFIQYEARKKAVAEAHPERACTGIIVEHPIVREDSGPIYVCGGCNKALTFDAGVWGHP